MFEIVSKFFFQFDISKSAMKTSILFLYLVGSYILCNFEVSGQLLRRKKLLKKVKKIVPASEVIKNEDDSDKSQSIVSTRHDRNGRCKSFLKKNLLPIKMGFQWCSTLRPSSSFFCRVLCFWMANKQIPCTTNHILICFYLVLSLFTIVRFNNDLCPTSSGNNGTCYTA